MLSQWSLRLCSCLFILFSLFCSTAVISTSLSSSSHHITSHSFFCLISLLLIPSSVFFISVTVLFISAYLFFKASSSLLNISCNFLVCASILFMRTWIIFTIFTLNSFSGRLSISTSLSCSSGVLSSSFVWNIFLCCLILSIFLCLWPLFLSL